MKSYRGATTVATTFDYLSNHQLNLYLTNRQLNLELSK